MAKLPRTDRKMMRFYEHAPIGDVLERLRERAAIDKLAEKRRGVWRTRALILGIALIVHFVACVILLEMRILTEDTVGIVLWGGLGAGVVLLIALLVWASRVGRADVEDRKYELALGVLEPLAPEIRAGRPMVAAIDFTGYADRAPSSTEKAGFFASTSTESYEHSWLELELPLRDGSTALVLGASQCKRKKKRKRKYTKVTDKLREQLQVSFRPPRGKRLESAAAETWAGRFGAISGLQPAGGRVTEGQVQLRFRTGVRKLVSGRGSYESGAELLTAEQVIQALVAGHRAVVAGASAASGGAANV